MSASTVYDVCIVGAGPVGATCAWYLALFMFFFTPVDEGHVEVTGVFSMKKVLNPLVTRLLTWKAMREGGRTIEEDIPIWEHKAYRSAPLLCDGDGPIMRYRQWTRQFYSEPA